MFLATERTRILIDAGLSRREIAKRLAAIGEDIHTLRAILVTHEHTDHTSSLSALIRASEHSLPVYLTQGDVVDVTVAGVGTLSNPVTLEA